MRIAMNLADNFMLCDNLESVILKIADQPDLIITDCAISEPVQIRELDPTNAQVLRQGTLFVWPKSVSSAPPIGSIIVDSDGVFWTVWKMVKKQHVDTWESLCLNLSIVTAPANTATILKATYTKGHANEAKAHWTGLFSGQDPAIDIDTVPARFQPSEETAELEFGAEWSKEVYRVYFQEPVPMEAAGGEYRIVDSEGQRYRVVRYFDEGRIDRLPIAISVKVTEGSEYVPGGTW